MQLDDRIDIDAPRDVVWAVTEAVERWPEWTPTVRAARRVDDGPFEVGSSAVLRQPGLPEAEWRVTSLVRGEHFTWEAEVRGIRMVATHDLADRGTGTVCTLRIELTGLAVTLLGPLVSLSVRRALRRENRGLKAESERRARART